MEFMFYHEQTRSTVHLACYKIACALAAQLKFITAPTIPMVFPSKIPCETPSTENQELAVPAKAAKLPNPKN